MHQNKTRSSTHLRRKLKLALLPLAFPLVAMAADQNASTDHSDHGDRYQQKAPAPLIEKVRKATWMFRDIEAAGKAQYVQGTPCVSGPTSGAMGVHFINMKFLGDGVLNANEPEALIYEPLSDGTFRLVGVEYIVLKTDWETHNPDAGTPSLDGNLLNFVGEPNRYGLGAFYEMHVWAWEHNPAGSYADFNSRVTCTKQPLEQ